MSTIKPTDGEQKTILIVEDEAAIRDMLEFALHRNGYKILTAEQCIDAEKLIFEHKPDLILLDWMLPGMSGVDFIKKLKAEPLTQRIPIVLLTAKAEESNKIKGFDVGADDYVTKPFSPKELTARIKAVLRRGPPVPVNGRLQFKDMIIDTNSHKVTIQDNPITLPLMLFRLLHFFVTHMDRIYSREQILTHVWQDDSTVFERTVDVQVRRLRKELEPYGYDAYIKTVHGLGYQFTSDDMTSRK